METETQSHRPASTAPTLHCASLRSRSTESSRRQNRSPESPEGQISKPRDYKLFQNLVYHRSAHGIAKFRPGCTQRCFLFVLAFRLAFRTVAPGSTSLFKWVRRFVLAYVLVVCACRCRTCTCCAAFALDFGLGLGLGHVDFGSVWCLLLSASLK